MEKTYFSSPWPSLQSCPLLKQLAHKVWVGAFQGVELSPSSVISSLPEPPDQKVHHNVIVALPRTAIQNLYGLWFDDSL
jgi:hypothetical protein